MNVKWLSWIENVIFFVWNWGYKIIKDWIYIKICFLKIIFSFIDINWFNYEKEFIFWSYFLKYREWLIVGILYLIFGVLLEFCDEYLGYSIYI